MKIFNYTIQKVTQDSEIKNAILTKAEQNAKAGVIQAKLELTLHTLLLNQLKETSYEKTDTETEHPTERDIRLTQEAIERDTKSINNWETQLKAIQHERQN